MTATFRVPVSRNYEKGMLVLTKIEKEVVRMELQISELIRVVANLNERLKRVEDKNKSNDVVRKVPIAQKIT